jgi:hypothetical protein
MRGLLLLQKHAVAYNLPACVASKPAETPFGRKWNHEPVNGVKNGYFN